MCVGGASINDASNDPYWNIHGNNPQVIFDASAVSLNFWLFLAILGDFLKICDVIPFKVLGYIF